MAMQCCGQKNVDLMQALEVLADDPVGLELYEQWVEMQKEPNTSLADWMLWEQDVERTPAAEHFFSLIRGDDTGEVGCQGGCSHHGV